MQRCGVFYMCRHTGEVKLGTGAGPIALTFVHVSRNFLHHRSAPKDGRDGGTWYTRLEPCNDPEMIKPTLPIAGRRHGYTDFARPCVLSPHMTTPPGLRAGGVVVRRIGDLASMNIADDCPEPAIQEQFADC